MVAQMLMRTINRPPMLEKHSHDGRYARIAGDLWRGEPRFQDVGQGWIGNCALMATFAACAAVRSGLIQRLFPEQKARRSRIQLPGLVRLRPAKRNDDEWVDEWVPVDRAGRPLYGRSPTGVQWPSMLERAFAQQLGYAGSRRRLESVARTGRVVWHPRGKRIGYEALKGILSPTVMSLITGKPTYTYFIQGGGEWYIGADVDLLCFASAAMRLRMPLVVSSVHGELDSDEFRAVVQANRQQFSESRSDLGRALRRNAFDYRQYRAYANRARRFGVVPNHAYALVGMSVGRGRPETFELYNPHANSNRAGGGLILLTVNQLKAFFRRVYTGVTRDQCRAEYKRLCG